MSEPTTVEIGLRRQADGGSPWALAILAREECERVKGELMTTRQEARALFQTLLNLWRDGSALDREEAQLVLETLALDYGDHGPREAPGR